MPQPRSRKRKTPADGADTAARETGSRPADIDLTAELEHYRRRERELVAATVVLEVVEPGVVGAAVEFHDHPLAAMGEVHPFRSRSTTRRPGGACLGLAQRK